MSRKVPRTTKYYQLAGDIRCPECGQRAKLYHKGVGQRTQELAVCKYHTLHRTETHWTNVQLCDISPGLANARMDAQNFNEKQLTNTGPVHNFMPKELKKYYWDQQDERLGLNEK